MKLYFFKFFTTLQVCDLQAGIYIVVKDNL
jgi:hypothetical protein